MAQTRNGWMPDQVRHHERRRCDDILQTSAQPYQFFRWF
jgi:hypothetical protein